MQGEKMKRENEEERIREKPVSQKDWTSVSIDPLLRNVTNLLTL